MQIQYFTESILKSKVKFVALKSFKNDIKLEKHPAYHGIFFRYYSFKRRFTALFASDAVMKFFHEIPIREIKR